MATYENYAGYCPEQDEEETIEIKYARIPILNSKPGYKKAGFICDFSYLNGCSYGSRQECPLYDAAPVTL